MWAGVIGIVLVALLSNHTVRTLLACSSRVISRREKEAITTGQPTHFPTYPEIGREAYGRLGKCIQISPLFNLT